jgi:hypothetical protein
MLAVRSGIDLVWRETLRQENYGSRSQTLTARQRALRDARHAPPHRRPDGRGIEAVREAFRLDAESARMAQVDSIQSVAPDPYPACSESNRLFLRGVAATPGAADWIKGDLCVRVEAPGITAGVGPGAGGGPGAHPKRAPRMSVPGTFASGGLASIGAPRRSRDGSATGSQGDLCLIARTETVRPVPGEVGAT